jgi:hypothetical protein
MTDLELILRAVNLFLTGLVVGALAVFQRSLVPVLVSWPADLSVRLHRDIIRFNPDTYIRPAGAISLVTGALALVLPGDVPTASVIWTIAGIALLVGVAVVSEALNQPINRRIGDAPEGQPPADHRALMNRWARAHLMRTVLGVAGLAAYIIGALEAA